MSQYESNYYGSGGGGGYLQGGSPFSQGGSPGGMRKTEVSNSLRPFTISQLTQASQAHTDAEWRVDDVEIGQVTIVAQVVSIQKQTTNSVYLLDDGTGKIEARHWVDSASDDDSHKWSSIEEMRYVRVTGSLKSFGKKKYINATHIRNITDPHEIYFHILEAITVCLIVERGPPSNPGSGPATAIKAERTTGNVSVYSAQSNAPAVNDQFAHLPQLQRSIMRFLMSQPPQDEGIHVAVIAKAIAGGSNDANKICEALDELMDQGHVFTTIDDSHFSLSL
ncbi:replication protein A, subunit RPA32 [Pholiota conissans]|uniref:Replication protein A, subunit RPA32 n=1 Tax=Pholiota conissans TaxID=109636 RepID=A0A9P6D6A7_9AGAR|nr:replication protein A, subunit RPA32 [Pholiota conissans]